MILALIYGPYKTDCMYWLSPETGASYWGKGKNGPILENPKIMIMKVTLSYKMDFVHKVGIKIMIDLKYEQDWTTLKYPWDELKKTKMSTFGSKKNICIHLHPPQNNFYHIFWTIIYYIYLKSSRCY